MEKLLSIISIPFNLGAKAERARSIDRRRVVFGSQPVRVQAASRAQAISLLPVMIIGMAAVCLALFLSYLWAVNTSANSGYAIRQLEKRIAEKDVHYKKLLVERSEANSMASVDEAVSSGAFVPVNAGELMHVPNNQLTQK